jgi:hypothetical protein
MYNPGLQTPYLTRSPGMNDNRPLFPLTVSNAGPRIRRLDKKTHVFVSKRLDAALEESKNKETSKPLSSLLCQR